jgi:hypothetical protein
MLGANDAGTWEARDPTTIALVLQRRGSPAAEVPGLIRLSPGAYYLDYLPPATGDYAYQFVCTGNCHCAGDGNFGVDPPRQ